MATLKELAQTVQIEVAYGAPYNQDFPDSHAYTIMLTYQSRMMQTPFYTGRGWTREPAALMCWKPCSPMRPLQAMTSLRSGLLTWDTILIAARPRRSIRPA
jgi:hypothetical protein